MCLGLKRKVEVFTPADLRFLSNGKDIYDSYANKLNGCVNDTVRLPKGFLDQFPKTEVRRYINSDVTANSYLTRMRGSIGVLSPGATVCIIADSCFSETITRGYLTSELREANPYRAKNRYYPNPDLRPGMTTRTRMFSNEENRCLVISGCLEGQTSADAWFSKYNQYLGALSCALYESISREMTWQEWFDEAKRLVGLWGFDQIPTLKGPEAKRNEKIGSSETLIIHNSSHGSNVEDENGDEWDRKDETLFFDKHVPDDLISKELDKIAA